jgi:transcriptional regulator with XRE-family HTH domain
MNGRKLADARLARGLTLIEAARAVGLSADRSGARTLSLIERNKVGTSILTARRLCALYHLHLPAEFEPYADSVWGTLNNARRAA